MDVLGADPDIRVRLGQRVADRRQPDERRADDPGHAGHARAGRDRPGQLARLGRGRMHLPIGGHDHVTHRAGSCQSGRGLGTGPSGSSVASRSSRSSARWTAERWISSRSASSARLASGVSRRASATSRTTYGCVGQPPVGVEGRDRVELATGRAHGALEVRRFGVEHAVELAAQGPRHLARLELEQRPGRPDPAQERPDRLPILGRHDPAAAPEPGRHGQAGLGRAAEPARRRPPGRPRTRGASGRRPGSASRGRGTGRGATTCGSGRPTTPSRTCRPGSPPPAAAAGSRAARPRPLVRSDPARARRPRPPGRRHATGRWRPARPGAP